MPALKHADRVVVSVNATGSNDWTIVSTPTGFQSITAASFNDNDRFHAFVLFEDGVNWEVYDGLTAANFPEVTSVTGGAIARPADANIFASTNGNNRVAAGTGTHTLVLTPGAFTWNRIWEHLNPTWQTFTPADATPSVAGYSIFKTNGTTPIIAFDDMTAGKEFTVVRGGADIALTNGAAISLPGGVDLTLTEANPAVTFKEDGGVAVAISVAAGRGVTSDDLSSTATGLGASLIGLEDAAGDFDAGNVEAALAELHGQITALENVDAFKFIGPLDASANPNYPAGDAGDVYRISVAGRVGGATGEVVEIGDLVIGIVDGSLAGDQATVGANWTIQQTNIDGAVVGPAVAVDGNLADFSGTSGNLVADSGVAKADVVAVVNDAARGIPAASVSGANTIAITHAGLGTVPTEGDTLTFPAAGTNLVTNPTIALNGGAASVILNASGGALTVGALVGGRTTTVFFDGTNWRKVGDGIMVNVAHFGAVGDNSTDAIAAFEAAVAVAAARLTGGAVWVPAGIYRLSRELVVPQQVHIVGEGVRISTIRIDHDTGYGIVFQHSTNPGVTTAVNCGLRDITVRAYVETTANAAVHLNECSNFFSTNVSVEDHFGGILISGGIIQEWANLVIVSSRNTLWPGGAKLGSFYMKLQDSGALSTPMPTAISIANFNFRRNDTTTLNNQGIYVEACDGLWLSNGHIMGCTDSLVYVRPSATSQITDIRGANIWFDSNTTHGLQVRNDSTTSGTFGRIVFTSVKSLAPGEENSNDGYFVFVRSNVNDFEGVIIEGGSVRRSYREAIRFEGGASNSVSGVTFTACNFENAIERGTILITSGADKVLLTNNQFEQTDSSGNTSNRMRGVVINAGESTQVFATANLFDLAAAAEDIVDASTSDLNDFSNNVTTKTKEISTTSGTSLNLPEVGDFYRIAGGVNFNNMLGRWDGRTVTFYFDGASTLTNNVGNFLLKGGTRTTAAGDTAQFLYSANVGSWIEL